jgi:hypothetical protein
MKDLNAGRHIAPALLTRLPVRADRTRLHGRKVRILETHVVVGGQDLAVLVSHWTSRNTDEQGDARERYADQIYGVYQAMYRNNPAVDLLICGDFNDPPDADSVAKHLHARGPRTVASTRGGPWLVNLLADKNAADGWGTHYYSGKWYLFDQIVVSPGLFDVPAGWLCDPASVEVVRTPVRPGDRQKRPWRFGGERDRGQRGYSDHLPVTVRLQVQAPSRAAGE